MCFGASGSFLNGSLGVAGAVADELGLAVDDHLGSEGRVAFEAGDVVLLADGPLRGRIGIHPTVVIPVVDVFFEGDDFCAGDGLGGFESG